MSKWFVYDEGHWWDGADDYDSEEHARHAFEKLKRTGHPMERGDGIYLLKVVAFSEFKENDDDT